MSRTSLVKTYKVARRVVIGVVGSTVVLIGIALIVLPGPAFLLIPLGLAILGIEFAWARHWLRVVKRRAKDLKQSADDIKRKASNLIGK
ncbi:MULTISPECIES: PGPGW domain-containing protein [Methylocaldum]|jgi:tellurite resistance protein TerC|uniref:PGPGW domain-containing protein n=1 Tax=unclassified Methylocaldum TaxID=2622260 RepID=UPI00098B3997|nr:MULTISPECIES: PGPGW domain-containing protein [unclassified Methylocaldum]MBP1151887.1 tellurite resistance protein TerC [Methylocaldum sp. RMAD-M]MVF22438.1 hypothetical protein [Methylocaldum sp. BRCS4]